MSFLNSYLNRPARLLVAAAGMLAFALLGLPAGSLAASEASQEFRAEADAFFTNHNLPRLVLEIPESGLASLRREPRTHVRATLREGSATFSNVAVHLKGAAGSFRQVDDVPGLTLNFTEFEPDSPRFHGLKKVHLNNSVQDPSRVSELVAGQMFREAGVPAARAAHALVELNGRKLGLYVVMEAMNKDFLAQYFHHPKGNLYGQSLRCDVTDDIERMEGKGPLTRAELAALAGAVRERDAKLRLERMEKTLDVERFLSFMALEVILGHWDGYSFARHNYRIYQDLDTGRMVFFPHDLDQLMVRSKAVLLPAVNGLVAQAVLNTPPLRERYLRRVCTLATNLFVAPRWSEQVDQAVASLLPTLQAYDPLLARVFTNATVNFKSRLTNRRPQLERQIAVLNGTANPVKFTDGLLRLTAWSSESFQPGTRLERLKDQDGKQTLWISAPRRTMAAWRTQVLLEAGRYSFEGMARCSDVEVFEGRRGGGASLAIAGRRRSGSTFLAGDSAWQKLSCEFEVVTTEDVELSCELRALKGDVWFDETSLRLVRLK